MAIVIYEDGLSKDIAITLENSLATLQTIVGGYIEVIRLDNNLLMVIDEEGKLKGREYNPVATAIARKQGNIGNDYIAGVAVVVINGVEID